MEILIATGIFLLVVAVSGDFIITGLRGTSFVSEQEEAVNQARRSLETISTEIRGANSSERGDYALADADDNLFVFYTDVNQDDLMDQVKYWRDDTVIYRIITPPGVATDYDPANAATTTIAQYINNQEEPVFVYFDNDLNETSVINDIRLVRINLRVNVTPTIAPNDYYVETDVHMRNLKDNL